MMKVEIAVASDKRFFPGLFMTVCSVAHNADRSVELVFHVLDGGIESSQREELEQALANEHPRASLHWLDIDTKIFDGLPEWRGCGKMTWARLLLPRLLPDSHWVIYFDVDFLCLGDVAELWQKRDDDISLMSVPDNWPIAVPAEKAWFEKHGFRFDSSRYFCAGFCFFNLERIRNQHLEDEFKKVISIGGFVAHDQSVLNAVFSNRDDLRLLDRKWQTYTRDMTEDDLSRRPMIHYAGDAPWVCFRINRIFNDSAILWFRVYARFRRISVWRALREFYSPLEIIGYRMFYLCISRIGLVHWIFNLCLKLTGREDSVVIYNALLHKICVAIAEKRR